MSYHRLKLITTPESLAALKARIESVSKLWPEKDAKPQILSQPIDASVLGDTGNEIAIDDGSVLVIGVPESTPAPAIYKTIDLLRAARISAGTQRWVMVAGWVASDSTAPRFSTSRRAADWPRQ